MIAGWSTVSQTAFMSATFRTTNKRRPGGIRPGIPMKQDLLDLELVVGAPVVQVVTQAGDEQRQTLQVRQLFAHVPALQTDHRTH